MSHNPATTLGSVMVRLFVAAILIAALAIVGRLVLPRAGLSLPLWVPGLTFTAIAAAVLLTAWQERPDEGEGDDGDDEAEDDGVAGSIGPGDAED